VFRLSSKGRGDIGHRRGGVPVGCRQGCLVAARSGAKDTGAPSGSDWPAETNERALAQTHATEECVSKRSRGRVEQYAVD